MTTGCCRGGFDKSAGSGDVAVHGAAANDAGFQSGGDRVRDVIDVAKRTA